ncbi:MAG: hypothetical protein Q9M97_03460 [Candidatus Gracilibacteria bacterium]|nr:hypothetical protein [Candidatus Gracilibacteria bacterium]
MKLNYINVITNDSIGVINELNNLLKKRNYSVKVFSAAFDEKGSGHILIGFKLDDSEDISQIISKVYKLSDVKEVIDMSDKKKQIKYLFNVNCNCKQTLKKISREPDKIIETGKELIYVFILKRKEVEDFISELGNLRLDFVQRVIGLT